jgi:hypothetical protein
MNLVTLAPLNSKALIKLSISIRKRKRGMFNILNRLFGLILGLIKVIISVPLNGGNAKGVSVKEVNVKEASIAGVNIASKSSSGNRFKGFFFLIRELIRSRSF